MDPNLYKAAKEGKIEAFKKTNDSQIQLHQLLTPDKNTVLHIHITSSVTDETLFVEEILNLCPSLLLQRNNSGDILLHVAARYGHKRIVKLLIARARADHHDNDIERGEEAAKAMVRTRNCVEETALHEAVRFGHVEVVRVLVDEDCFGLHEYYGANEDGETPLYMAAEREHDELVSLMLDKCSLPPESGGPCGRTVLHAAVISHNAAMTGQILKRMGHLTKKADDRGWVPLHFAARLDSMPIVKDLLRKDKDAAYIKDKKGRTPLHLAASGGKAQIMSEILSSCPDCGELVDDRRWNALHFAVESNEIPAVRVILDDPSLNSLLNGKDSEGNTPLHVSTALGRTESQRTLVTSTKRVDKMAFNKKNRNVYDIAETTWMERWQMVKFLRKVRVVPGKRVWIYKDEDDRKEKREEREKDRDKELNERGGSKLLKIMKDFKESILVVATLIATVTFTAGFTLPGGYVSSDNGPLRGTAVLRQKAALQAFIITDTIAMIFSSFSVLIQLILSGGPLHNIRRLYLLAAAYILTMLSMMAMVIAFVTGTFAVLAPSFAVAVATCVIGLSFFVLFFVFVFVLPWKK